MTTTARERAERFFDDYMSDLACEPHVLEDLVKAIEEHGQAAEVAMAERAAKWHDEQAAHYDALEKLADKEGNDAMVKVYTGRGDAHRASAAHNRSLVP